MISHFIDSVGKPQKLTRMELEQLVNGGIVQPKDTHDCAVCGDHPTILEPIDYEQEVCEETAGRFATRDEQ